MKTGRAFCLLSSLFALALGVYTTVSCGGPTVGISDAQTSVAQQGQAPEPLPPAAVQQPTSPPGSEASPSVQIAQDVWTLRQEVRALQAAVAALRARLETRAALVPHRAATGAPVGPASLPAPTLDRSVDEPEQADPDAEQRWREQMDTLEAHFWKDPADDRWATEATTVVWEALNHDDLGSTVVDNVTCRATLCRIEVAHDDPGASAVFQDTFPRQVTAVLPHLVMDHVEEGDGQTRTVVYLVRTGFHLPR